MNTNQKIRLSHQERKLNQKTNEVLVSIAELSCRDKEYPFTRDALAQDQYEDLGFNFGSFGERSKKKREAVVSVFENSGKRSVGHTVRALFSVISDSQKTKEERLQSAIYLTQIAFLMAEVSGLERKEIVNKMMVFCAQESSLKDIQKVYRLLFRVLLSYRCCR